VKSPRKAYPTEAGPGVDSTDRVDLEQNLYRECEFARRLVDSSPDCIVALDSAAVYNFVSPRVHDLLGYSSGEILGRRLGDLIHPADRPVVLERFEYLFQMEPHTVELEFRARHKSGHWVTLRANAGPLCDTAGRMSGVVASARDVTEAKRLELQLVQSEKLDAMGQLIGGVAHELNNPLAAILGASDILRENAADDLSRHQATLVYLQAQRAASIVQSLLTFSRPPAQARVRLNLDALVRRALEIHEEALRAAHITLDFPPTLDLPDVEGDSTQLIQVFLHLIVNAEQAMHQVQTRGVIHISLQAAGSSVIASIQDEGPGIPRELLPRIFDPFFTTRRPGGGAGLGLTLSLAIIHEHGGSIEALNAPSGGALFRVALPSAPPAVEPDANSAATALPGRSILIIEDEESISELVRRGLIQRGLFVDVVAAPVPALNLLADRTYDFVLCDFYLLGDGGLQIAAELLRKNQASRLIFTTGGLIEETIRGDLNQAGSRVLQKPFRVADLVVILEEMLVSRLAHPSPV
jgi:two-component system, NtrC family, sensor kinase